MAAVARALFLLAAFCLAAFANVPRTALVGEKPHLGVDGFALASRQGVAAANALNAPGLCGCLYDSGGRSRSTGKERDAETGLDFFGARYMSAAQGRFMRPDAPFMDQFPLRPQSWNLYSYARNNPMAYVDRTGQWISSVHFEITRYSLGGLMTAAEINTINKVHVAIDKDQSTDGNHKHAMRRPGESWEEADNRMWQSTSDNLELAKSRLGPNGEWTQGGVEAFGEALHAIQDSTSPSHRSDAGEPYTWRGAAAEANPFTGAPVVSHAIGENRAADNWSRIARAVRFTLAAYLQANPKAAKEKGLTSATFEQVARKRISKYVHDYYRFHGGSVGEEEAANQCAMGNPAACR